MTGLDRLIRACGYQLFTTGPRWRAERLAQERFVIDIAVDAIVDVLSYKAYQIDWGTVAPRAERGRDGVPVPRIEDLVAQKLISAREKDLLDVLLVASEPIAVRGDVLAHAVEMQDAEIQVARGCLEAA